MTAGQIVAFIEISEPGSGAIRDEIGAQTTLAERAAHDLLHFAFMQIYARPKPVPEANRRLVYRPAPTPI